MSKIDKSLGYNIDYTLREIKKNPGVFLRIPNMLITESMCYALIEHSLYGLALKMIPKEMITEKMCDDAIAVNPSSIEHMPKKFFSEERIIRALENVNKHIFCMAAFMAIPKEMLTNEVLRTAMRCRGEFLGALPKTMRTPELCELAVESYGTSLYFVPDEEKTFEMCLKAIKNSPHAITYVPEKFLSDENCQTMLTTLAANSFISLERIYEIIPNITEAEKTRLKNAKKTFKNMCYAVIDNPEKYDRVPSVCLTNEFYEKVLIANPKAIHHIPHGHITQSVQNIISKHEDIQNECVEYYLALIEQNSSNVKLVPPRMINKNFCKIAVNRNGDAYQYLPVAFMTDDIRDIAEESIAQGRCDDAYSSFTRPKPSPHN